MIINKAKIIIIVSLAIIMAVGITTSIILRIQNKHLLETKFGDTVFIGDIIERAIENAMKVGNNLEVQRVIENMGKNSEVMSVRVLSSDGTILKSNHSSEIGIKSPDFMKQLIRNIDGKPTMPDSSSINYFKPIMNRQECLGCHSSRDMVNGIIQVRLDISRNISSMLYIKKLLIISNIVVVLAVLAIVGIIFSRFIFSPLKHLILVIKDFESGNWNTSIKKISNNEIGTIASAFNKMIEEIKSLHIRDLAKERELAQIRTDLMHKGNVEELNLQLEFRIKELETANRAIASLSKDLKGKNRVLETAFDLAKKINETGKTFTSVVDTEEILKTVISTTVSLFNPEKAILHVGLSHIKPITIQHLAGRGTERLSKIPEDFQIHYDKIISGEELLVHFLKNDSDQSASLIGAALKINGHISGAIILECSKEGNPFNDHDLALLRTLSAQATMAIENARLYDGVKRNYFSTIQALVNAVESNDIYSKGHSERVKLLSLELGRFLGLDLMELDTLEHAAILHDIGKIGIENFLFQKQGMLSKNEYGVIKSHPVLGEEILSPIEMLKQVRQTIIQHHERYDGRGYPYGLGRDELSLGAKILSVADSFDAMMSERPFRKSLPIDHIKQELIANSGSQFDPYVVRSFIDLIESKGDQLLTEAGYNRIHMVA